MLCCLSYGSRLEFVEFVIGIHGEDPMAFFNMQSSMYFGFVFKNTQIINKNKVLHAMEF